MGGGGGAPPAPPRGREAALSLEALGNCCPEGIQPSEAEARVAAVYERPDGSAVSEHYEIRKCRCKSWFCAECAKLQGLQMRRDMTRVLSSWSSILMVTLTIDPTLFPSAEAAYRWVRERRGLGRLIDRLKAKGYCSGRYVWFIEFHENGWPHWHVMIEASWIPHAEIEAAWGANRPDGIERQPGRPLFGFVDVRGKKFASGEHAANYGTKYLIKEPRYGWPEWVLDFRGRVTRYGVCRGFWVGVRDRSTESGSGSGAGCCDDHPPECFCECCREGIDPRTGEPRKEKPTPRERVASCGGSSMLIRVRSEWGENGIERRCREVVGICRRPVASVCRSVGVECGGKRVVCVGGDELKRARDVFSPIPGQEGGVKGEERFLWTDPAAVCVVDERAILDHWFAGVG